MYYFKQLKVKNSLNKSLMKSNKEVLLQKLHIEEQSQKLEELNETKSKVISVMSHDVKSPIASLQMLLNYVETSDIEPEVFKQMMKEINSSVTSISLLLENILGWSKTQMETSSELEKANLKMQPIVDEVINLYAPIASKKNIQLINNIPDDCLVLTNKDYMLLILRNLISNAIKFTPQDGNVTITAKETEKDISIAVSDNGIGMSNEEINKLFNVKQLYSSTGTNKEKGTGLGLLFVKESAEKCGGQLIITSKKDEGCCMSVVLPHGKGTLSLHHGTEVEQVVTS
jgi:signal transduction histidine kinase